MSTQVFNMKKTSRIPETGQGSGLRLGKSPFVIGNKLGRGRPPTVKSIPDILRKIGDRPVDDVMKAHLRVEWGPDFQPVNNHEAMLMVATAMAIRGNLEAMRFISERTEGKVPDVVRSDGPDLTVESVRMLETAKLLEVAFRFAGKGGDDSSK